MPENKIEIDPKIDDRMMDLAFREAGHAWDAGEVPIGCVITKDGVVIGKGHNRIESLKDPTAHAEIIAIGAAASTLDNWRLEGCTLYVTLEPCPMCTGAILNSRIGRVVWAADDKRFGACGSTVDLLKDNALNRIVERQSGLRAEESLAMIREFFQQLRERPKGLPNS
jgi:tRNA(adenine34) deaminase